MHRQVPNILTLFRILSIPVILTLFIFDDIFSGWIVIGLVFVASITDFFDGYIARKYNIQSTFGQVLDPIADKVVVVTFMMALTYKGQAHFLPAMIIVFREIFISGLRESLLSLGQKLPVISLSKLKTTVQMFSLGFLIGKTTVENEFWLNIVIIIADSLLFIGAALALITGIKYCILSFKLFS